MELLNAHDLHAHWKFHVVNDDVVVRRFRGPCDRGVSGYESDPALTCVIANKPPRCTVQAVRLECIRLVVHVMVTRLGTASRNTHCRTSCHCCNAVYPCACLLLIVREAAHVYDCARGHEGFQSGYESEDHRSIVPAALLVDCVKASEPRVLACSVKTVSESANGNEYGYGRVALRPQEAHMLKPSQANCASCSERRQIQKRYRDAFNFRLWSSFRLLSIA